MILVVPCYIDCLFVEQILFLNALETTSTYYYMQTTPIRGGLLILLTIAYEGEAVVWLSCAQQVIS